MRKLTISVIALLMAMALAGCDQLISRNFGGETKFTLPVGTELINVTWKGASLWVLYYEPLNKTCVFAENSVSGSLQGRVTIPNCNPLALAPPTSTSP